MIISELNEDWWTGLTEKTQRRVTYSTVQCTVTAWKKTNPNTRTQPRIYTTEQPEHPHKPSGKSKAGPPKQSIDLKRSKISKFVLSLLYLEFEKTTWLFIGLYLPPLRNSHHSNRFENTSLDNISHSQSTFHRDLTIGRICSACWESGGMQNINKNYNNGPQVSFQTQELFYMQATLLCSNLFLKW